FDHLEEFSGPLIPIHIAEEERIRREHVEYISRMEMLFTIKPHPRPTFDHLEEFSGTLIPIHIAEEERIRREHAEYISRMEMLFTIKPHPRPMIDIVTNTDVLPPGFENDDSDREIDVVDDVHVDNSISNSEHELSNSEASDFDNLSFPRPPPKPLDANFKLNSGEEISVVRNTIVEFECIKPRDEFDVSNDENDDYYSFMFVIYPEMFPLLLSAESEDTIFDPGIFD
nr:hypothetical protein [Tanacetum cinerariifolium]